MRCHRRRRATPQMCRNPLAPFGLGAVSGPLRRCRSLTMTPHRRRHGALHRTRKRPQRDPQDFYHGLLAFDIQPERLLPDRFVDLCDDHVRLSHKSRLEAHSCWV